MDNRRMNAIQVKELQRMTLPSGRKSSASTMRAAKGMRERYCVIAIFFFLRWGWHNAVAYLQESGLAIAGAICAVYASHLYLQSAKATAKVIWMGRCGFDGGVTER